MQGFATIASRFGPKETTNRLEGQIVARGMQVFARIDHAAGAAEAGLELRPTELIIFGNARAGTPLMQANQTMGIDLPLKVLVWQDAAGKTWLSYDQPAWLAQRHGISDQVASILDLMEAVLSEITSKAAELASDLHA